MADSTEGLTPVLIPFEKATYEQFKAQQGAYPNRDILVGMINSPDKDPLTELNRKYAQRYLDETKESIADPNVRDIIDQQDSATQEIYDRRARDQRLRAGVDMHQAPDGTWVRDSPKKAEEPERIPMDEHPSYVENPNWYAYTTPTTTTVAGGQVSPGASSNTSTKNKKKHKDWSDSDVDLAGGLALASNAAGSLMGGLATLGDASHKLVQGILNPGLVGQGAAAGVLGAADTMVTPTKESKARQNNLMDAAQLTANRDTLMKQIRATQANNQTKQMMEEQAKIVFQNTPFSSMYDNPNLSAQQYEQFITNYQSNLEALRQMWQSQNLPPELIEDVMKAYSSPLEIARYNNAAISTRAQNDVNQRRADEEASVAAANAASSRNIASNIHANFTAMQNNPQLGFASRYLEWAQREGYATQDPANNNALIPTDMDMFIDGMGNTIDSPNFNPSTARLNYGANGSAINDFANYLDSTGDANDAVWATQLRVGKLRYDEDVKLHEQERDSGYFKLNFKHNIGRSQLARSKKGAAKALNKTQEEIMGRIFDQYGPKLGLNTEQIKSLASNGGLASTSVEDYEALKKIRNVLTLDRGNRHVVESLENLAEKIETAAANGQVVTLTDAELELYREELIYENLSYRLEAMERMHNLDNNLTSFSRRFRTVDGEKYVDDQGFVLHASQMDAFHRFRDLAYSELRKSLYTLNDDLDEALIATYNPSKNPLAGGYMDTGSGRMVFQNFGTTLDTSQAIHLANMVHTDHDFDGPLGLLGDPELAGLESTDPANLQPNQRDRRTHLRFLKFMGLVNNAANLLGGMRLTNDSDYTSQTLSEEGTNTKAATNQLIREINNKLGIGDGSAANIVGSLPTAKNPSSLFIDPHAVARYGYGEFYGAPPKADDIVSIKQMRDALDGLHGATNTANLPVYSSTQAAAMKQYRAALVTNTTIAYLQDCLDGNNPQGLRNAIRAYKQYTGKPNINDKQAVASLKQMLNSGTLRTMRDTLRLAKPGDARVIQYLGKGYANYKGAPRAKKNKSIGNNVLASDPQKMLGLMDAIFEAI